MESRLTSTPTKTTTKHWGCLLQRMKKTSRRHFTNWRRSTILIRRAARPLRGSRRSRMHTKSSETRRRSRCMIVQGPIPNNSLPISRRLIRGSSSRAVASARASVGSPGVVLATPMEGGDSISRSTRGRAPRIRLISIPGVDSSKRTQASNRKPAIPTTGLLTARNTTRTQVAARVQGKNTRMSSSGCVRKS